MLRFFALLVALLWSSLALPTLGAVHHYHAQNNYECLYFGGNTLHLDRKFYNANQYRPYQNTIFSPDGNGALALYQPHRHSNEVYDLVSIDTRTRHRTLLQSKVKTFSQVLWSPDGQYAAFLTNLGSGIVDKTGHLLITTTDHFEYMLWSYNSQWLAFISYENNVRSLSLLEIRTNTRRQLPINLDLSFVTKIAWSPDGTYIAILNGGLLTVIDSTHLTKMQLDLSRSGTTPNAHDLAWSPDSHHLTARVSFRQNQLDSVVAVTEKGLTKLLTIPMYMTHWTDTDLIYLARNLEASFDLWSFQNQQPIVEKIDNFMIGPRYAYIRRADGNRHVEMRDLDGSNPTHLLTITHHAPLTLTWQHSKLVVTEDNAYVWVFSADGKIVLEGDYQPHDYAPILQIGTQLYDPYTGAAVPRPPAPSDSFLQSVSVSPNGQNWLMLYSQHTSNLGQLFWVSAESTRLLDQGSLIPYNPAWSPDSQQVAFMTTNKVMIVDAISIRQLPVPTIHYYPNMRWTQCDYPLVEPIVPTGIG